MKNSTSIRFIDSGATPAERATQSDIWYRDGSGRVRAGLWATGADSEALNLVNHADEFCVILEGTVRLTDAAGHTETYREGDTFMIPSGFTGTWESVGAVRKFFLIHDEPKAS